MGRDGKNKERLTVGILGGMGPDATIECYKSIIEQTPARRDQEHLHVIIDSNPQIPDRTEAILYGGYSPVPLLQESARRLEGAGADFVIIPCNTAHYFIEEVRAVVGIPVLNMVGATMEQIPDGSVAGLLATTGTVKTRIYEIYAGDRVEIITPPEGGQETVMGVIYGERGIKAGYRDTALTDKLVDVAEDLRHRGADAIIAGCTEIRLVLSDDDLGFVKLLTPIDIIARKAVQKANAKQ